MAKLTEKDDKVTITGDEVKYLRLTRKEARKIESNHEGLDEAINDAQGNADDAASFLIIEIAPGEI